MKLLQPSSITSLSLILQTERLFRAYTLVWLFLVDETGPTPEMARTVMPVPVTRFAGESTQLALPSSTFMYATDFMV
ncbi:hypothetical protein V496_08472 [Pseudogymnoascus sp. VKM F-4515 (FW-2607)]|nr:hypothetical protein V496_08472 [Pseudogymnoascus sp. VKM F-4515 (FW-2607)]